MPRPEVLERIKTAEDEAAEIIDEAEVEREERIAAAEEKLRRFVRKHNKS
jgi:hypothetical protein